MFFCFSVCAKDQNNIKIIHVQTKKITVENKQIIQDLQTKNMIPMPLRHSKVWIDSEGNSKVQCDIDHSHEKLGELK